MRILCWLTTIYFSVFLVTTNSFGQTTYTWNGSTGDWSDASNWSPSGVPGSVDTAITIGGSISLTEDITVAKLEIASNLSGDFDLEVTNLMVWNGQSIQGAGTLTITENATLHLAGSNQQSLFRNLVNNGTTIWEAGNFYLGQAVSFTNNGTFLDQISESEPFSGGAYGSTLVNNGTYKKTGVGLSNLSIPLTNDGVLEIEAGEMRLNYPGTSSDSIKVASDGLLTFHGYPWVIGGSVSGAGNVEFWGHTITIQGNYNITGNTIFAQNTTIFDTDATIVSLNHGQQLVISGRAEFNTGDPITIDSLYLTGHLMGSDSIAITKSMIWIGNAVQGSGTLHIAEDATLRLAGSNQQTLYRNLVNNGTTIWEAGNFYLGQAATFTNNGTFFDKISVTEPFSGGAYGCTLVNNGTYTKTGAGQSNLSIPFYNQPTGTIKGIGNISFSYGLSGEGAVSPGDSLGTINFTVNYTPTSTSVLNIEIGGTKIDSLYDNLNIIGTATLDGTLNISLANNFVPVIEDTFEIVTFSSYTGSFHTINGLNTGMGVSFEVVTSPTAIKLATIKTPNSAPVVAKPVVDITLPEDFGTAELADLDTVFSDVDIQFGDSLSYMYHLTGSKVNAILDGSILALQSQLNVFGQDTLIISTTDKELMSIYDTIAIEISAVNDAPEAFSLLSPTNGSTIDESETLYFEWEESVDVDEDIVEYTLYISTSGWDTSIVEISSHSYTLSNASSFASNTSHEWSVTATDGTLETASNETFTFTTPEVSGVQTEIANSGIDLGQNYPNPFVHSTSIDFSIPITCRIAIKIYDMTGKLVHTLVNEERSAGSYSEKLDFSKFPNGVYLYKLETESQSIVKKMTKVD